MNILDENAPEDQRSLLQSWRIPIHQVGFDVGRKGMQDEEIIRFLHQVRDVTFFTRDLGFYDRKLCHSRYCLVCLAIGKDEVAVFVRRVLHHSELDAKAKRMGSGTCLSCWAFDLATERAERSLYQLVATSARTANTCHARRMAQEGAFRG
jgi:hypothetical protein